MYNASLFLICYGVIDYNIFFSPLVTQQLGIVAYVTTCLHFNLFACSLDYAHNSSKVSSNTINCPMGPQKNIVGHRHTRISRWSLLEIPMDN